MPHGCSEYGRYSFHDKYGYSSTVLEKAQAIDSYFVALQEKQAWDDQRLNANGSSRGRWKTNSNTGEWEWEAPDWDNWGEKMCKIIPKKD